MLQDSSNRDVVILIVALSLSQLNCQYAKAAIRQGRQDESVVTMEDIQRLGEASLDEATRSYIASGADREQTLRENTAAFSRLRFRPRCLVDVSRIHTATTVLGRRISFPVGFSPSAAHMIAHEDGELGTAKGKCSAFGLLPLTINIDTILRRRKTDTFGFLDMPKTGNMRKIV